jgi:hypothetical protein
MRGKLGRGKKMIKALEAAIAVVGDQTRRIRRRLRKNRNRLVYRVESGDVCRNVRTFNAAVRLARRLNGGWVCQGEQNARWIRAGRLTGIKWNRRRQWNITPPAGPVTPP